MNSVTMLPKQFSRLLPQTFNQVFRFSSAPTSSAADANTKAAPTSATEDSKESTKITMKPKSERYAEFEKKLRAKTPIGKLDEHSTHPYQEKEPLKPWPNNTNPNTGEVGGPAGPEPTRYGDWERKGRVSDF